MTLKDGGHRGSGQRSDANGDALWNIENLIGSSHADTLVGNSGSNVIEGGAGADHMNAGEGNDWLSYRIEHGGRCCEFAYNEGFWRPCAG